MCRTTVAPLDAKVAQLDKKTQDKAAELASHIETVENDLSRTKERLSDTDAKAIAANQRGQSAEGEAVKAGLTADEARALEPYAAELEGFTDGTGNHALNLSCPQKSDM